MEQLVQQHPVNYEFRTAIMWFRRDLRVDDNPALVAALNASALVIPVFIWAPEEEGQFQPGRCSRWWSKHSLIDLQQALAALGSRLIIRRSTDSTAALLKVVSEVGAEAVFFNHLYDPISLMRDHDCKRGLTAAGVAHRTFNGDMLYEPWEVLDSNKQPYSTFDDFWNSIRAMPVPPPFPVPAPEAMPPVPAAVPSLTVTEVDWFFTADQEASSDQLKFKWKPGVGGAIAELERFATERLHVFEHDRAKVDRDSTSRLSPWIHIGSISVRYIFYRVRQCQAEWMAARVDRTRSCDDFLQQVGYREYSRYLSFHFPFIHERSLLRHLRACPWRIDQHAFKAWRQGQTGYPIVDAAMRQLWSSGWCHNRARVVAASFLVKDLLLPWQWGLKHYWDAQIDADLECDALGWQYVSGGMSDAHPFSYMMDPEKEARRFDPDGEYVRRWLPVLSRLPTQYIHAPWKAPPQVLASADVELGCNYPAPIVTREDAQANVQYACSVLDKCVVQQSSESSGRYPYRAPTYPVAMSGAGASSGANPTVGAGGAGPSAGTGAGAGGYETGRGGAATNGASAPPSQQNQYPYGAPQHHPQTGHGGMSAEGQRRDSRSGSAAGGTGAQTCLPGSTPVSAPVSQAGGAAMGPPPPPTAVGAGPAAPGGAVYYHPGDAAGQQLLEQILQQQRRTRAATARHQDGSGTDRPPAHYQNQHQQLLPNQQAAAAGLAPGGVGVVGPEAAAAAATAAAAAAAAWAGRVEAGEADEEAVELWQQQQMLPGGTAAYAFEQAMQMLLAQRRMRDGVSVISGDQAGGDDPDGLALDDATSEEVVSNTVNVTAFTGASYHRGMGGTARGARKRGRAEAKAGMGGEAAAAAVQDDGEATGSPTGSSPVRSAGDEADPLGGREGAPRRSSGDGGDSGHGDGAEEPLSDDEDEIMSGGGEAEAESEEAGVEDDDSKEDLKREEGCTPRGGVAEDMAEDGSDGRGRSPVQHQQERHHRHRHGRGGDREVDMDDRMDDSAPSSPPPPPLGRQHHAEQDGPRAAGSVPQPHEQGGAEPAAVAAPAGPMDYAARAPGRWPADPDFEMTAAAPGPAQPEGQGLGLGLHKRRRTFGSGRPESD